MPLLNSITRFARSPQGQKLARQARELATDPKTKRKIDEVRRNLASRRRPPR